MKYVVGVDVGGTKISVVLANQKGKILRKELLKTKTGRHAHASLKELFTLVRTMIKDKGVQRDDFLGIGLGIPGAINSEDGIITRSPNLPGWEGIEIKNLLRRSFKVPVFLENDANVACIAEKVFGAGQAYHTFLYVTISTGIGAGIMVNNMMLHGAGGYGGEIGHAVVYPDGRRCNCGKYGCLEAHASGTAIGRIARESIEALPKADQMKSTLFWLAEKDVENIDAALVAAAARKGDPLAKKVYAQMGEDLGVGFASVMHSFNPQAIILGGSVTKSYALFGTAMKDAIKLNAWAPIHKQCKILLTKLGDQVTDLGTVALVLNNL